MGVQIETMKEGDGATFPQKGQKVFINRNKEDKGLTCCQVSCHYVLTLENGKKVDSSRDRGRPFQFTLGKKEVKAEQEEGSLASVVCDLGVLQVIAGWEEGIAKMSKGQRAKLTISSDMG